MKTLLFTLTTMLLHTNLLCLPALGEVGGGNLFGSGRSGVWITDADGLPAYQLDLAALRSAAANGTSLPTHLLGNKIVTALIQPEGYTQLFTTRTFPRFANGIAIDKKGYVGGFGYVQESDRIWSTGGPDLPSGTTVQVTLGMGYVTRVITSRQLRLTQKIYLSNEDEAVVDEISFTNLATTPRNVNYLPYYDVNWTLPMSITLKDGSTVVSSFDASRGALKVTSQAARGDLTKASLLTDPMPKVSYLVALNRAFESFETRQANFFGNGTRPNPAAVMSRAKLANGLFAATAKQNSEATVLAGRVPVALAANQTVTLYFAYGIADVGQENAAIDRLRTTYTRIRTDLAAQLNAELPRLQLPEETWLEREMAWNYYSLRAGLLKEEFWKTGGGLSILNQGGVYLYQLGGNNTFRDPLQFVQPLFYIRPDLTRDTLLYVLKNIRSDGSIPYGTSGYGAINNTVLNFQPSDPNIWLLKSVAEYVFVTRDFAFLQSKWRGRDDLSDTTVQSLLKRAYLYQVQKVGYGSHGLPRILNSDWNDVLISSSPNKQASIQNGESTMNAALAVSVYGAYAKLIGNSDPALASQVTVERQKIVTALKKQWRGTYFNRAYVATTQSAAMNEVGGQTFWLEPNAFALLNNDLLTPAQLDALVTAMKTQLSDPSPNGMAITAPNVEPVFVRELTVSSWHSINGTAIQGLLQQSGVSAKAAPLAWTEFKKNTLAVHAEMYPNLWYGIWTGPDSYFNETHRHNMESWQKPGGTWMEGRNMIVLNSNFPAGNPHTHSQPLLNTIRFAGIEADALGFRVMPKFPFPNFSWNTPTHSVTYTAKQARGTFRVATQQPFRVTVLLPTELQGQSAVTVKMNGTQTTLSVTGKTIQFTATPDTMRGVVWSVE